MFSVTYFLQCSFCTFLHRYTYLVIFLCTVFAVFQSIFSGVSSFVVLFIMSTLAII